MARRLVALGRVMRPSPTRNIVVALHEPLWNRDKQKQQNQDNNCVVIIEDLDLIQKQIIEQRIANE